MELKKFLNIGLDSIVVDINGIEELMRRICALAIGCVEFLEKLLVFRIRFFGNDELQKFKEKIICCSISLQTR